MLHKNLFLAITKLQTKNKRKTDENRKKLPKSD